MSAMVFTVHDTNTHSRLSFLVVVGLPSALCPADSLAASDFRATLWRWCGKPGVDPRKDEGFSGPTGDCLPLRATILWHKALPPIPRHGHGQCMAWHKLPPPPPNVPTPENLHQLPPHDGAHGSVLLPITWGALFARYSRKRGAGGREKCCKPQRWSKSIWVMAKKGGVEMAHLYRKRLRRRRCTRAGVLVGNQSGNRETCTPPPPGEQRLHPLSLLFHSVQQRRQCYPPPLREQRPCQSNSRCCFRIVQAFSVSLSPSDREHMFQ